MMNNKIILNSKQPRTKISQVEKRMNKSRKMSELKYEQSNADEQLSIIPTNEAYKYIYSDHEYGVRKQFWEIMFKDWIEQQKEKE